MAERIDVKIESEISVGNVSPFIFGHFIENMFDCIDPGLHAQLLTSRGFEFPDKNNDGVSDPWEPIGTGSFSMDEENVLAPQSSQRVQSFGAELCGIIQRNLKVSCCEAYSGSGWVLANKFNQVEIVIKDDNGAVLLDQLESVEPKKWKKIKFHFESSEESIASIRILVKHPGTVWLDQYSIVPESAVCKVWRPVMEYVKNLRPTIMRFPGGCFADCYHWMDGIGNEDLRPARPNLHWGGIEENGFGTDEFIAFCRAVGCEPMICVNFGSGDPDEAAAWVEYCNGSLDTKYGQMRAKNGHAEPYNVKYWDIGNETFADWEIGHCSVDLYCERFVQFSGKMRAVDQSIKLIACGEDGNSSDQTWNDYLCSKIGRHFDFLGVHNYPPLLHKEYADKQAQYYAVAGAPELYERRMAQTAGIAMQYNPELKIAVTEWNCNYQDGTNQEQAMEAAICNAGMIHAFVRLSDKITMANVSDLINGWAGGLIRSKDGKCYGIPSYYVLKMFSECRPYARLGCQYHAPAYTALPVGNIEKNENVNLVDIIAFKDELDATCVSVINRSLDSSFEIQFEQNYSINSLVTLSANDQNVKNTFGQEIIVPIQKNISGSSCTVAPCSVNIIYIQQDGDA